jgi:hypothetical protein
MQQVSCSRGPISAWRKCHVKEYKLLDPGWKEVFECQLTKQNEIH